MRMTRRKAAKDGENILDQDVITEGKPSLPAGLDMQPAVFLLLPKDPGESATVVAERDAEFRELVASCDLHAVGELSLRTVPTSKLFGSGNLETAASAIASSGAEAVMLGCSLTAVQERGLTERFKLPVVDREQLILDIFARRASAAEGKLQVELAQLRYQASRLVRGWTHLERQRGDLSSRGGPGEKQIELDRRELRRRIARVKKRVDRVHRHRCSRSVDNSRLVALVGYTNAGKTSLFNAMAKEKQLAENRLFATLDPRRRSFDIGSAGQATLIDTVGFIRNVPHDLIAAFRATLSEINNARLILVVVDGADSVAAEKEAEVLRVLEEIGAAAIPRLRVLTKADLQPDLQATSVQSDIVSPGSSDRTWLDPQDLPQDLSQNETVTLRVSAIKNTGLKALRQAVAGFFAGEDQLWLVSLKASHGKWRALLHERRVVEKERVKPCGEIELRVRMPASVLHSLLPSTAGVRMLDSASSGEWSSQ